MTADMESGTNAVELMPAHMDQAELHGFLVCCCKPSNLRNFTPNYGMSSQPGT